MINYDTIKSVYEDKLTLMQWLVKVQKALKDATAVSFNVNKRGDATLTFSILFDDGTELETDPIILEQGESVENATLRNGHLILTLTNGDELDAGDMGAVSSFSIDANQHLIVTYQDGSTDDLGAIFTGNVTISGNLTAVNANVSEKLAVKELDDIAGQGYIDVLKPLKCFDKIVDTLGNKRFLEGNGVPNTAGISGLTSSYCKWSLSGTHLMLVFAGSIANGTSIPSSRYLVTFPMPTWITGKIFPVWGGAYIEYKSIELIGSDWSIQTLSGVVLKQDANNIAISNGGVALTLNMDRSFRLCVDLLIDNA